MKRPTSEAKRIILLDVYRGFAIFGIFVVNIGIMNSTFLNQDVFALQWTSALDQGIATLLQLFFYTKFFPIFSLLFGIGIAMQLIKRSDSTAKKTSFFYRRMGILWLFGLCHILFLWSGDVIHLYAIIGLVMLPLVHRSNGLLLLTSVLLLLFPYYDPLFASLFDLLDYHPEHYLKEHTGASVRTLIRNGNYTAGMRLRVLEYFSNLPMLLGFLGPIALSMFLLGIYLGKNQLQYRLKPWLKQISVPMLIGLVSTSAYRYYFLFHLLGHKLDLYRLYREYFVKLMVLSDVFTGLFYLWIIGMLWYYTPLKKVLSILQFPGRMALTNYLAQSLVGLILFSSIGFSRYETFAPSETFAIACAVFCCQTVVSWFWLRHYNFGPLEWVWRCLSYGKLLPLRKRPEVVQQENS